jgi:DNA sulfur modification protein DndD
MAMELKVKGWKYRNIRGGIRDLAIDLDDDPRWTLIQMPNGTGKTTTMTLLRAALTGVELSPVEVNELRADDSAETGEFELRLEIDGEPYRITIALDFIGRRCTFSTTSARLQSGGSELGWHLPPQLRRLLTPDFSRLFVFDGEFAKEIRAVDKDRTTKSIRTLYRLDQLDALRDDVRKLVDEEQERAAEFSRAKEQKGITRLSNALDEARTTLAGLEAQQRSLQREQTQKGKRLEEIGRAIADRTAQDEQYKKRMDTLDGQISTLNAKIAELTATGLTAMRSPTKISPELLLRLRSLGDRLTTLQLPKTISVEFFHELARAEKCVCDRDIGEKESAAIVAGASKYLAEDQITVINRMKKSVRETDATGLEFSDCAQELRTKLRERRSVEQQIDQLQQEKVAGGDVELQSLLKEQAEIKDRLGTIDRKLKILSSTDRQLHVQLSWNDNISLCRAEVKLRAKRLATATNTYNFVLAADKVKALIDRVAEEALNGLRESVRTATNQKLARLVTGEPLQVSRIGSALELSSEGLAAKGGVSEGQSLSVAYAFLTSLLSAAPYKLPFIVDSPAVSLDTQVRREVGDVIPGLFDQMIMFVISSERDGFADAFYPRDDVRYITVWRDGASGSQMREGLADFRTFHSRETSTTAGGVQ